MADAPLANDPFATPIWPYPVADLPNNRPFDVTISAAPQDAARISKAIDALKVAKLVIRGRFEVAGNGTVSFEGKIGATVTQPCVVTLEPVRTRIDEPLRRIYRADDAPLSEHHQILADDDVDVDPLPDVIDLGQVAAEALALSLPAFPRAEGAELQDARFTEPGKAPMSDDDAKPFAGLAALKDQLDKQE